MLTIIVSTLCTWMISKGNGEKIVCDDLQLGQYPFEIFEISVFEAYFHA